MSMAEFLQRMLFFQYGYPVLTGVFWTCVGACIGSFLNVCIWRIPNGMSLITPPSHCPKCGHSIPFYENIPVFSWFLLRGKCSSCHEGISIRYPIVEAMTAMTFLGVYLFVPPGTVAYRWPILSIPALILWFVLASVLIASAFTDCDCRIIPDGFVLTLLGAEILYVILAPFITGGRGQTLLFLLISFGAQLAIMGFLLSGIALLGKALYGKTALGWGDVKLLTVMTPVLTFYGMIWVILFASIQLIVIAPLYRKIKPKMRHRAMPFAPFIALGTAIVFPILPDLCKLIGIEL